MSLIVILKISYKRAPFNEIKINKYNYSNGHWHLNGNNNSIAYFRTNH